MPWKMPEVWPFGGWNFSMKAWHVCVWVLLLSLATTPSWGEELYIADGSDALMGEPTNSSGVPIDWKTVQCKIFKTLPLPINRTDDAVFRCSLVRNFTSCSSEGGIIPYLSLIFCSLPSVKPLAYVVLCVWLVFLFVALGTTAEDFFCPALTTISQTLGLSQNIAGVTFLAIGNGAPDIFSAFAAIQQSKDGEAGLAIGALFGAGVFVTTTVVGAICITRSFALTQRPFLRDVIFYLAAVFWTFYVLWNHEMSTWQAAGFIGLYFFYVLVVIVGRYIYVRRKKRRNAGDIPTPPPRPSGKELEDTRTSVTSPRQTMSIQESLDNDDDDDDDDDEVDGELRGTVREPLLGRRGTASSRSSASGADRGGGTFAANSMPQDGGGGRQQQQQSPRQRPTEVTVLPPPMTSAHQNGFVARRSMTRQDSRTRSGSFHGVTDHIREVAASVATSSPAGDAEEPDVFAPETTQLAIRRHQDLLDSCSHTRMRKSTLLVAGALAGLASSSSAAAVPRARMPRIRRSTSMGHIDVEAVTPSMPPTPSTAEPPSSLAAMARRRQGTDLKAPSSRFLPLKTLLLSLMPVDRETFSTESLPWKLYDLFKAIIQFFLLLTTPVVMLDQEDQNWNRHLNSIHCVTGPVSITLLISGVSSYIGGTVPTVAVVAGCGILLGLLVFFTSRNDVPPRYHRVFAFAGFCVAVVWIYAIANEIVSLLTTFGIVFGISDAILGLTLLAWGNSIGDFVSNVTMAKQGFPRMAIAACFGGPLLNVLLGIGIACLAKSLRLGGSFCLHFRPLQIICASFLMASLCLSLICMSILRFNTSKKFGIGLICFYLIFLTVAVLEEVGVIPWTTSYVCTP